MGEAMTDTHRQPRVTCAQLQEGHKDRPRPASDQNIAILSRQVYGSCLQSNRYLKVSSLILTIPWDEHYCPIYQMKKLSPEREMTSGGSCGV